MYQARRLTSSRPLGSTDGRDSPRAYRGNDRERHEGRNGPKGQGKGIGESRLGLERVAPFPIGRTRTTPPARAASRHNRTNRTYWTNRKFLRNDGNGLDTESIRWRRERSSISPGPRLPPPDSATRYAGTNLRRNRLGTLCRHTGESRYPVFSVGYKGPGPRRPPG